jgi:hypothetical protein
MDPASIVGLVSASLAIATRLIKTTRDVNDLSKKYHGAQASVALVESRIKTIKIAVSQLERWYSVLHSEVSDDIADGLESALVSCATVMKGIQAHFAKIRDSWSTGVRYLWEEKDIKLHERNLDSQIAALHLLISALQLYVCPLFQIFNSNITRRPTKSPGQGEVSMAALHGSIRQAGDDASSYLELERHQGDSDAFSAITNAMSELQIEFQFDESIVNSKAYRRAFRSYLSSSKGPQERRSSDPLSNISSNLSGLGRHFPSTLL